NRKRRRMRSLLLAALNCFIRNEPGVAPATLIAAASVRPASDVALVLIRNAESKTVDFDPTRFCEVENVFVAIVEKPFRVDRLEMTEGSVFDCDGLDPVNRVLQNEGSAKLENNFVRQHRIRWRRADVEEKRAARLENPPELHGPIAAPLQIRLTI